MLSKHELCFTSVPAKVLAASPSRRGSGGTGISWTWHYCQHCGNWDIAYGESYNRWIGCDEVSKACRNCWAKLMAKRKGIEWGIIARRYFIESKSNDRKLKRLNDKAIREGRRIRVFPVDMGDWCEDLADYLPEYERIKWPWMRTGHPDTERLHKERLILLEEIKQFDALDYLTLTKRPQNIEQLVDPSGLLDELNQLWLGITTEDQETFDERWEYIKDYPNILWLSCEPLVGPIKLPNEFLELGGRGWVVVGGESGAYDKIGAYDLENWRYLRDQCVEAGIPIHHKQYGGKPRVNGIVCLRDGHGSEPAHWFAEDRVREWPR